MVDVTFIEADGCSRTVSVVAGSTLMRAAVDNGIYGITADCGGCCACGTCHAYIAAPWRDRLPLPRGDEEAMLDGLLLREADSRLACQINLTPELDGIVVRLPGSQV